MGGINLERCCRGSWLVAVLLLLLGSLTFQVFAEEAEEAARITDLRVQCSRSGMTVHTSFDRPFYGTVYSKGHYESPKCTFISPRNHGRLSYSFNIPLGGCGTRRQEGNQAEPDATFLENTLIIQGDPLIQAPGDGARNLRCIWRNNMQKAVGVKLQKVYEPKTVTVRLDAKALDKLANVQTAPANDVTISGIVYTNPTSASMVLYIKGTDNYSTYDGNVDWCLVEGIPEVFYLTDADGCVTRNDLLTPFYKSKDTRGVEAHMALYTFFKGLKIPKNNPNFAITCQVEVCKNGCSQRYCRY